MISILNKNNVNMAKKFEAFTLAEVLITLTIIGVIAAITIPNLIQSYKKHQVEVGVKEAYSILSNAFKMGIAENGQFSGSLYNFMKPYVKIKYDCGCYVCTGGKGKDPYTKCFKPNKANTFGTWTTMRGEEWETGGYGSNWGYQTTLENGMNVYFADNSLGHVIVVDINGPAVGPSQLGTDVFAFTVSADGIMDTYTKGIANKDIISSTSLGACNAKNNWGGFACARAIQMNGWKIPDDYPVKKF